MDQHDYPGATDKNPANDHSEHHHGDPTATTAAHEAHAGHHSAEAEHVEMAPTLNTMSTLPATVKAAPWRITLGETVPGTRPPPQ